MQTIKLVEYNSKFRDIQLKKSNKKVKELEDKIKELKLQLTSQCLKWIVKKILPTL